MRATLVVIVACAAMLAMTSCAAIPPLAGHPADKASLVGRSLVSTSVVTDGNPIQLVPGAPWRRAGLGLEFYDASIAITGGCNWYSTQGTEGWDVVLGRLAARGGIDGTIISCDDASDQQDHWIVDVLRSSPEVNIDGAQVVVRAGPTVITFVDGQTDL
ncbi:MAG TPA: hypothetical protein VIK00_02860 [Candidatus Limnocylindrales bacterium]